MVLEYTYLQSCLNEVDQCLKLFRQLLRMSLDKLWAFFLYFFFSFSSFYLFGFSHYGSAHSRSSTSINRKLSFRLRDLLMHYMYCTINIHYYLYVFRCARSPLCYLLCVFFLSLKLLSLWFRAILYRSVCLFIELVQLYFLILWNSQLWFNIQSFCSVLLVVLH